MAIKGKGKGKARTGRAITAGPRPAYVAPKTPLFQRTGAKFTFVLVIEVIVFALLVGFGEQSEGDRQRAAVNEFSSLIDASLFQGEAVQQLPGSPQVLPQLQARLPELLGEDPPPAKDVVDEAESWAEGVLNAGEGISQVEVPSDDLEPEQGLALTEARNFMERGLAMYAGLAHQVGIAAQIEGDAKEELITTIQNQLQVAASTFGAGYGKLQDVRRQVGLPPVTAPPGGAPPGFPPGVPPGGAPPGFEVPPEGAPGQEIPIEIGGEGGGGGGNG